LSIYEFSKICHSTKTSDKHINFLVASEINSEIYIILDKSIAVWSLNSGVILRRYENLVDSKIHSMAFDKMQKVFFLGLENGNIRFFVILFLKFSFISDPLIYLLVLF